MAQGMPGAVVLEVEVDEAELSPEDIEAAEDAQRQEEEARVKAMERLDAFGQSLARTRSEAIAGRQTSGVEDIWLEDDEHYEGIDNANRGEHPRAMYRQKPPGQAAAASDDKSATVSTIFPNITAPFTDAAAARIADMLLPTDDANFKIGPTPVPEMEGAAEGKPGAGMLAEANRLYAGDPAKAQSAIAQAVQEAAKAMELARGKAEKAQTRIEDWHVECQYHAQVRLVIEDSARIGTGILKGPVPIAKTRWAWYGETPARTDEKTGQIIPAQPPHMEAVREIKPGSKRINPWNFYPDPACGESIHNGSYTWEKDALTKKQLRDLINEKYRDGTPLYIQSQIEKCLGEGPTRALAEYRETPDPVTDVGEKDKYEVWYYHGTAEREDIQAAGCDCDEEEDAHLPVMITLVNNRVIRVSRNPLDTGEFPYDVMVWRRREGHWTGTGVARHIRPAQRMVTGATRHLMDNAGLAAGPMLVMLQGVVAADGKPTGLGPRRIYKVSEDAEEVEKATDAIGYVKVDMLVSELTAIINLGLRFAEDCTGLPMLLQGQMGKAPDTVGGMTMLNNNANATLRRLARLFDDRITEPHIRRYYHWLLQYGEEDEKGDYCIDARGSSALVERDIQNQQIPQILQVSLNPVFGMDPIKTREEWLKSLRFDPKRFDYDDEQWKKIVENMSKGPQDQRVAVEQLRGQFNEKLLQLEQAFEQAENAKDREHELLVEAVHAELERNEQAGAQQMSFADIKAMLAKTAMTLRTQRELSMRNAAAKQVAKPAAEPSGRAKPGRAFQA